MFKLLTLKSDSMLYCYSKKYLTGIIALILTIATADCALAQDAPATPAHPGWLHGIVVDEYSHPLKGVTVMIKGKGDIYTSGTDGSFEVDAPVGATLIFSTPDRNLREVTAQKNDISVKLEPTFLIAPPKLDVLYGSVKRESMLGAISTLYTNQLTTTPASLFVYAFPGQLAGMYTSQYSGFSSFRNTPLSAGSLIGQTLINNSSNNNSSNDNNEIGISVRGQNPITVIDGVQREISSIDPESIESISVLKDGLSTILLGMNSSRPVILVTTKRGVVGKPRINFTANVGLQQPLNMPTPLPAYQYAYLVNEMLTSDGKVPIYTAADIAAYRDGTDPYRHPDVNWFKLLLKDYAPMTSYKLNVNGGSNVATYSVSLGFFNQTGIFKTADEVPYNTNADLSRYVINSNVGVQVTKNLNVALQLFGRVQTSTQPGPGYSNILNGIYSSVPNLAYPARNPDGTFGGTNIYTNNLLSRAQYSGYAQNNTDDILANLDLNYDLGKVTPGLTVKLKGNLSYQSITSLNRALTNAVYKYNADNTYSVYGGASSQNNIFTPVYTQRQSYGQAALNYERQFGKNGFGASLMYDTKSNVTNYDLPEVINNLAAKATYNYDGKYLAEAAVTRSSNNRYAPGRQWGTFYAAGLGWQMGKEKFMEALPWINSWKWRANYARTGNANISSYNELYYAYNQTYGVNVPDHNYTSGTAYSTTYYYFDNTFANPYIRWESADKISVGADISMFKDHLQLTAEYYNDRYFDKLGTRGNTIALLGTSYTLENIGRHRFEGTELTLTYKNNIGNFNYFVTGNGTVQDSKILYMDELATPYPYNARTGLPVNINGRVVNYGYTALGFYQTSADAATAPHIAGYNPQPGDLKYKDLNGDGVINLFDQSPISNTKPLIFYGLNFGFNYKGLSLSVLLQGVGNRQINAQNDIVNHFGLDFSNTTNQTYGPATGRWTPETANTATLPRLSVAAFNNNGGMASTFWIKNGNYMRLKNAELGYSLPLSVTKKMRLGGLRVFVNGENLATIAGFKGLDPEVFPTAYPIQRVFNAGVSIKL